MSEPSSLDSLPERQIPDDQVEKIRDFYVELLGFVPPRIQARTDLLARVDPDLLAMQEDLRRHWMYPDCFDTKTSQLFLFAILLTNLQDAAKLHALAAYRAGAINLKGIKSRAIRHTPYRIADGDPEYAFVHVGLLIREGRPIEVQKDATQRVMKVLKETFGHLFEARKLSLTVDLKEMRDGIALTEHNIVTK